MVRCNKKMAESVVMSSIRTNKSALSAVIGSIMMVLLLIFIASVVYFYVESSMEAQPKKIVALFDVEYSPSTAVLTIQHISGDTLKDAVQQTQISGIIDEDWWHQDWKRRYPIQFQNSININNEKQFQISIPYDSDMNPDFSDLRFIDTDGSLLSYWIEDQSPSSSATVWINLPSLPSGEKTILLYYGNQQASSESNPDATFPLFVNFTRDGIISYGGSNQDRNPSQWEVLSGNILRMYGNNWKAVPRTINCDGDGSQSIDFSFKSAGVQAEINGIGLDTDNSISSNRFYRIYGSQNWGRNDHVGYTGGGSWESYSLLLNDYSGLMNRFTITNDADSGQNTNVYYRNIRIRSCPSQNPTILILSDEEEHRENSGQIGDYQLKNLQVSINEKSVSYDSISLSTSSSDLYAGNTLTIVFNETKKPEKGDTITVRYVPTNQLLTVKKIV